MKKKEEHVETVVGGRSKIERRTFASLSPPHTGSLSYYSGEERKGGFE